MRTYDLGKICFGLPGFDWIEQDESDWIQIDTAGDMTVRSLGVVLRAIAFWALLVDDWDLDDCQIEYLRKDLRMSVDEFKFLTIFDIRVGVLREIFKRGDLQRYLHAWRRVSRTVQIERRLG